MDGHSGHSVFFKKCLENKIVTSSKEVLYKDNNRQIDCPLCPSLKKSSLDLRLKSEKFRQSVRIVLAYLGLENTKGNFKKYDKKHGSKTPIGWEEFAYNITHPHKMAVVRVMYRGKPSDGTIGLKLPGRTKAEAIKNLDTEQYKFERWF